MAGFGRILLLVIAGCTFAPPATAEPPEAFGPSTKISGIYFTNFENSVFIECADKRSCRDWAKMDGAWVDCSPAVCRDLDARTIRSNGSPNASATYAITFVGKRMIGQRPKRFLNDRNTTVLIERILKLRLIATPAD